MSSEQCCTTTVANIKEVLIKKGLRLPSKRVTPLSSGYRPRMDVTAKLKADGVQWCAMVPRDGRPTQMGN